MNAFVHHLGTWFNWRVFLIICACEIALFTAYAYGWQQAQNHYEAEFDRQDQVIHSWMEAHTCTVKPGSGYVQ